MDETPDLRIGDWWVLRQLNELHHGARQVRIEARSMDVLHCLVQHPGEVVSKEQILNEVWGDVHVTEGVISHAVSELRRVFGDTPKRSRYIQTVHRRGYRLVATVHQAHGAAEPRLGAIVGQGFRLTERLGQGAMGIVFKAEDEKLHREVALKFLPPELSEDPNARRRFLREARLAARLDHPNLATVHDVGETPGGRLYIVTAFYGGGTLRERLRQGPLPVPQALDWIRQLAEGLRVAHKNEIVHRDVKPSNILFTEDDRLKLADFGIAKLSGSARLTQTGASLGTPTYKSPEQSRGEDVDPRTDIWSLGVVLFEMLTGRAPFRGDNDLAILHAILDEETVPLERDDQTFSPELTSLVHRALAKDADQRFASTTEFLDALRQCRDPSTDELATISGAADAMVSPSAFPQPLVETQAPEPSRRLLPIFGLMTLLVILAIAGLRFLGPKPATEDREHPKVSALIDQGMKAEDQGDQRDGLATAIANYEQALELDPENPEVLAHLALALSRLEQQDADPDRRQRIEGLVQSARTANLWLAHWAEGKLHYLNGRWKEAEDSGREAMERAEPHHPWADSPRILVAYALVQQDQAKRAVDLLEQGLEESSGIGYLRLNSALGHLLGFELGRPDEAIPCYRKILDVDPDNFDAHHNLGTLFAEMGRYRDALKSLQNARRLRDDPRTANSLGKVYFSLARAESNASYWRQAIESFEDAIALDPTYGTPHLGLGDCHHYGPATDKDLARESYLEAWRLYDLEIAQTQGNPKARTVAQRALAAARLGRFLEAIQAIESLGQDSGGVAIYAARIYALADSRERLFEHLELVIEEVHSLDVFVANPEFDPYQKDPRFRQLLDGDRSPVRDAR